MTAQKQNTNQAKTVLRIKLENLSSLLKKLAREFMSLESDKGVVLLELQMTHKLLGLSAKLQSLESLEGKDGEAFVFFLKNLTDIIEKVGELPQWKLKKYGTEDFGKILVLFRNLEEMTKELLPIVMAIDDKRKEANYETFGGLLQKFIDAIEEKRHLILQNLED